MPPRRRAARLGLVLLLASAASGLAPRRAALAAPGRSLALFGLTQRDKAAHQEKRDAMIEARRGVFSAAAPLARAPGAAS